jgi:DNA adenine methylase
MMINSPLRYPGGKAKLFPFFADLIAANRLFGVEYCEPYAGGAGLAIRLLTEGYVNRISLNDIDTALCAFWKAVLYRGSEFCQRIETTPITIDEWYRQREIWRAGDIADELALGFATYFLNRTNRSGIIESAGPIGGYKQNSDWLLSARLIKDKQIDNIRLLSRYSSQIDVTCMDAMEFVSLKVRRNNSLIYLDPPYYVKGRKLYKNFYCRDDHVFIARKLRTWKKANWVVSYDDIPEVRSLYDGFSPLTYSLNYSAGRVALGSEVLYLSDALSPPKKLRFPNVA